MNLQPSEYVQSLTLERIKAIHKTIKNGVLVTQELIEQTDKELKASELSSEEGIVPES